MIHHRPFAEQRGLNNVVAEDSKSLIASFPILKQTTEKIKRYLTLRRRHPITPKLVRLACESCELDLSDKVR
jgi:hypothetical protein